jgi:hypothetical protein
MIEKTPGTSLTFDTFDKYEISCDFCSTGSDTYEEESWSDMIHAAKEDGWQIYGDGGKWEHKCPECAE